MLRKNILRNYTNLIGFVSRLLDPVFVVLAAYIAYGIKFGSFLNGLPQDYRILAAFSFFLTLIIFQISNIYTSWRGFTLFRQARVLLLAWLTVVLAMIVILFGLKISHEYSRLWLGLWAIIGLVILLVYRICIFSFIQYKRSTGRNLRHVILVGAGDLGRRVVEHINKSPWMGYKIDQLFDDSEKLQGKNINGCIVNGTLSDVESYLSKKNIDEIWLALPLRAEKRMKELLHDIRHYSVNIKLIPDIFGFFLINHSITELAGLPAVNISASPMDGSNGIIKKVEDVVMSVCILILAAPLMLLIALLVKLTSPGPVFYKQERVSWNGKPFMMYKFRSMSINSELNGVVWGGADKMEVTNVGRFLRKTSLDELPQFINVLKGDMSIVGPRPERTEFVNKFKYEIPGYMQKHMVKAGITGWAQVNGWRGDTCLKTRIEYDLYYIENWSLWLDLKILLLTVFKGLINKNAY